jgi:hypothetical protein
MALILRPLGQRHDPGRDLDDEHDEADPEHQEQPAGLTSVLVVAVDRCSARSRCTRGNSTDSGGIWRPRTWDTRNGFRCSASCRKWRFAGSFDAGGGTRTPDTRIMIPLL